MDRPLGPRQPDKRNAAYESIFGRPSASHQHHQPSYSHPMPPSTTNPMYYQNQPPPPPHNAPYTQQHAPPYAPSHGMPPNPSLYRQSFLPPSSIYHAPPPSVSPAYHHHPQAPPPHAHPYYAGSGGSSALLPPPSVGRARSTMSNAGISTLINPRPEEPPDPALEALTRAGLTPAQAYQAQVYSNSPARQSHMRQVSSEFRPMNGASTPPRLGPHLLSDGGGGLGIDFSAGMPNPGIGIAKDNDEDEDSELPWARRHSAATPASSLYVDTTLAESLRNSVISTSPSSFNNSDLHDPTTPSTSVTTPVTGGGPVRHSSDSVRPLGPRRDRTVQDRSMSVSAATNSIRSSPIVRPGVNSIIEDGRDSPSSVRVRPRKSPLVYPAMLSRVAEAFRERITLADRLKDGLTYKESFDGREAVDKVAYIIKTSDRNLALLLGRALDAQKFFHDVTYDHRLRDSANELYQFRTKIHSPFVSGEVENGHAETPTPSTANRDSVHDDASPSTSAPATNGQPDATASEEIELPSGVFTLLTDCYSPTCSRDSLCYSIACPRRLEQQARLNMKPQPGLAKQISRESLGDVPDDGTLWIHSVSQDIVDSVSDAEKRRQEAINEVIYTERDFVRDMEYLRDSWIKRLQDSDVVPAERRTSFLEQVFWNVFDIISVNTRLRDALNKRQKSYAIVEKIGDILLDVVPHFSPFVSYGAHQMYGKYEFEKEKNSNPDFAAFVEATERFPESRKLELNAYLTKPTTRLARYPLLLEAVLKHTPDDSPDKTLLPQAITIVKEFLARVNTESGKSENRFNLMQLDSQLVTRPGEEVVNLRLREEGREMIYKGPMNKRDGELQVYLFDHALLFTKAVKNKHNEHFKVYRRPIPLELLYVHASEDAVPSKSAVRHRNLTKKSSFNRDHNRPLPSIIAMSVKPDTKGYWMNFVHLGRKYYNLVLWASSQAQQKKWLDNIQKQQQAMRERSMFFDTVAISENFFTGVNKVNCAVPYNGGRRIAYGTDDGVYVSDLRDPGREPVKVLALLEVLQVDVLEDYQLLIVLSERQVITFPLDALNPMDPMAGLKRAKRISSHTSFFKAGICLGRMLVCIVKSSQLSSTFKTLEPIDQNIRGRSKPTFRKLLQGGHDTLQPFREFYIPVESTSIHYLKTKMCVGCSRGFEIVDLESLDTQGLLDPTDDELDFVRKKENLKPMAIYRIHNEFLLCYDEFAFYVNKTGKRSRKNFLITWEGTPTGFALYEPFILAFEPNFVEIRHIETGLLSQVIQGSNLRLLFADNPPSVTNTMSQQQGYYNNPYQPGAPFNGGGYPMHDQFGNPVAPQQTYGAPSMSNSLGRDEILMVSDDRVLSLRATSPRYIQQQGVPGSAGGAGHAADNMSIRSMPRR